MSYYSFNVLGAVREAASRLDGEFTYHEVLRLVREEHPEFGGAAGGYIVSNYLSALLKEGSIVRVKYADRKAHAPGVYRNAVGTGQGAARSES